MRVRKSYPIDQGPLPIHMTHTGGDRCGNCHSADAQLVILHGKIQVGKRELEVRLVRCMTCYDHHHDFVTGCRR